MNTYDKAARITLSASFVDNVGTAADPTSVILKIKAPDTTVTEYTGGQITKDSTGHYHMDFEDHDPPGTWTYRFEGDGAIKGGREAKFVIARSDFD